MAHASQAHYQQYIDGTWCGAQGGRTWDVIDPATEEVVRAVPFGGAADCRSAIEAAARAFPAWSRTTPYERGAILRRAAERMRERAAELARTTTLECGKPLPEARGEWMVAADLFDWYSEEGKRAYGRTIPSRRPDKRMVVIRQPIGVVGVITAWNFPAYNPSRAWAAALAAGCTVVARPSEQTPLTAMELVKVLAEAGLPPGALNLVNGEPNAMGQEMLGNAAVRKVSFTGSTRVGRILMDGASRTHKRLSLELGGNAPVLVFPDADLDQVAAGAVAAKFRNAGQVCVSPQRFLVSAKVHDALVARLAPAIAKLRVGSGLEPETRVGPLVNAAQRDRVESLVEEARARGASIAAGGRRPAHLPRGFFYEPTLVGDCDPEMALFREEAFGPVIPVARVEDFDEAIARANDTPYGLAAYVFTNDLRTAMRAAERLEFGMVGVNDWVPQAVEAPFPGWKQSGLGAESGLEGLLEYLETKLVAFGGI